MDAILQLPPLPPHDTAPFAPVAHQVIAEWPAPACGRPGAAR